MDLPRLDLAAIGRLTFERPMRTRFPCLSLAKAALRDGGAMPAVLNAANEIAVAAFMAGQIGFYAISRRWLRVFARLFRRKLPAPATVADALAIDREARETARRLIVGAMTESARL